MNYFIGQTRFSIYQPESKAWNISQMNEEEYLSHLFSDERISSRITIFLTKSLPLLQKMSEKYNYRHILSYSSHLPQKWKDKLLEAEKKNPVLYLQEVDTNTSNPILSLLKDKAFGTVAYFRLDDDDLISLDYLDQLSKYNTAAFKGMAISFSQGYAAFYDNDRFSDFRSLRKNLLAIGLAYIGYWGEKGLDLNLQYSHHNLDLFIPVIVDSRKPTFFWTHHDNQDSLKRNGISNAKDDLRAMNMVKDLSDVSDRFPTLKTDINDAINNKHVFYSESNMQFIDALELNDVKNITCKSLQCEYSFSLIDSNKDMINAVLICIQFKDKNTVVKGLMLSPNPKIGYYKYVSFINGKSEGVFSVDLNVDDSIECIRIVKWNKDTPNLLLENISLSN